MNNLFVVGPSADAGFIADNEYKALREEIIKCAEMTDESPFWIEAGHLENFGFDNDGEGLRISKFNLPMEEFNIDLVLKALTKTGAINNDHGRYCAFTRPREIHETSLEWESIEEPSEWMYVAKLAIDTVNGGFVHVKVSDIDFGSFCFFDGNGEFIAYYDELGGIEEAMIKAEKYWKESFEEIFEEIFDDIRIP